MNALKRPLVLVSAFIVATLLLSWKLFDDAGSGASYALSDNLSDEQLLALLSENADLPDSTQPPAAEDVLVQRIAGDNNHLLLMAYYSKENYSAPSFTIENGYTITLRDDGRGDDKTAGDGLYTAKIPADVKALRAQLAGMAKQMRADGYKPLRYINRQLVLDPDMADDFAADQFDANQPVSISGITNALSSDLPADISGLTTTSGSVAVSTAARASTTAAVKKPTLLDSIKQNSIFITNLAVIEDPTRTWNECSQTGNPDGPWTFGTLMRQLASKDPGHIATIAQVSNFVKNWLNTWATTQVINGDTVAARTLVNTQILNPWLNKSKSHGAPSGQLDMKFAPFKLTAIVNRFDLRDGQKFGLPGSACGEGRFVFCLVKGDCSKALPMTIIFEYGISKPNTCESQHAWAQQWVNLKNFAVGSSAYNQALQNITDQFALCGTNPSRPNQSSLDQLRTNEITLSSDVPKVWELREFNLDNTGNLQEITVGQTPADRFNAKVVNADVQLLASYVNKNRKDIKAGVDIVPLTWKGLPFLGGKSRIIGKPTGNPPNIFHWDGTDSTSSSTYIVDNAARSNFSVETCAGCHGGEAQTAFTHVDTAFFGKEATLSGFLTGRAGRGGAVDADGDSTNGVMTVKDAALRPSATNPSFRSFSDITNRASGLKGFVSTTCGSVLSISSQLLFQPTTMVH